MAKIKVYESYTDEQLLDALEDAIKDVAEGGYEFKYNLVRDEILRRMAKA